MTNSTRKTIEFIKDKNYSGFNMLVSKSEDLETEVIDKVLLHNRDFDIQVKIDYYETYGSKEFLSKLEEDICNNYMQYDCYSILLFALTKISDKTKKLVQVIKAFMISPNNRLSLFKKTLENYNYYNTFIEYIKNSNNDYLKLRTVIFLNDELCREFYESHEKIVDIIKNSSLGTKEKIEFLLELSKNIKDKELLTEIENIIITSSKDYYERLDKELETFDEELVVLNKINYDEYLRTVLSVLREKDNNMSYLYK